MGISTRYRSGRAGGRVRKKSFARRLEILEARTLLNASIDIDADGLLTYKTDDQTAETLNISVSGGVYTFASTVEIDVSRNVPNLDIGGDGTMTVTVEGVSGLRVDLDYEGDLLFLYSANVATTLNWNVGAATARLGDPVDAAGLGALSAPITATGTASTTGRHLLLNDYGSSANTAYTLTPTTLTATNGFGGLTYSNAGLLTLLSSTASNDYLVQGTADGVATSLNVTNPGMFTNTFTVESTSSAANSILGLYGDTRGGGGSNTFNIQGASSPVSIVAGSVPGTGSSVVNLGNSGGVAGINGQVWVSNTYGGVVDIVASNLAGGRSGAWTLSAEPGPGSGSTASLTGFNGNGSLLYDPIEINSARLGGSGGAATSLTVDFKNGNPLPRASGAGVLAHDGGGGAPSDSAPGLSLLNGQFENQTHDALSPSSGRIVLEAGGVSSTITYDGLGSSGIYDRVGAISYTFNKLGAPTVPVSVKYSTLAAELANSQALWISAPGSFVDNHVAWKQHITINSDSTAVGGSVTVDYRSPTTTVPVPGLKNLTIVTGGGDDSTRLMLLPPNVLTTLRQGDGDDQAVVIAGALVLASGATLDGGPGVNALTIDASRLPLTPDRFAPGPNGSTVVDVPLPRVPITYSNYQRVTVTNLESGPVNMAGETFRAIQDKEAANVVVARFLDRSPGAKASDFAATIDWGDGSPETAGSIVQDTNDPSLFYVLGTHVYEGTTPRYVTKVSMNPLSDQPKEFIETINGVPVTFEILPGARRVITGRAEMVITDLPPRPPVVTGVDQAGVQGQPFDNVVVATFTSAAPGAKASDFSATIDWGDRSPRSIGSITQDPNDPSLFYVRGSHTYYVYAPLRTFRIVVTTSGSVLTEIIDGVPVDFRTPPSGPVDGRGDARLQRAPFTMTVNSFTDVVQPAPGPSEVVAATFSQPGGFNPADPNPSAHYLVEMNWGDGTATEVVPTENIHYDGATGVFNVIVPRHPYEEPGSYWVHVAVTDHASGWREPLGGGSAVVEVVDASLSAVSPQPTIPGVVEGTPLVDRVIGSFTAANPWALVENFTATIDWGDGSPTSPGRVVQPEGPGTPLLVLGSHAYASARSPANRWSADIPLPGPQTVDGTYQVRIHVQSVHGATVALSNTITVLDREVVVTGQLDPASDSGVSNSDGITNINRPRFFGFASEVGATVFLYATAWEGGPTLIGRTTADAPNGAWGLTPDFSLPDGGYTIQAQARDASGYSISAPVTIATNLIVDTVGPRIINALLAPRRGLALTAFEDFGGPGNVGTGLVQSALTNPSHYRLSMVRPPFARLRPGPPPPTPTPTAITVEPGTNAGPQRASIQINNGRPLRPGRYGLAVSWATPENPSGVADIAGNSLEGPIEWRLAPAGRTPIQPVPPPRPPIAPPGFRFTTMRGPARG